MTTLARVPPTRVPNELTGYLPNESGRVPLVMDIRITHERFGSSSHPTIILVLMETYTTLMVYIGH